MKKNNKIIMIICIVLIALSIAIYFGTKYFLNKDLEKQQKELEEIKNNIIYSEKETVKLSIAKFNTEIMDNGLNYPVSDDYLAEENGNYFYGIFDDISFYNTPIKFTGNQDEDITKDMAIYYPVDSKNEEKAQQYVKYLIKSNNNELNEDKITSLIKESETLSKKEQAADGNNGLFISYDELDGYKYYIVTRNYKDNK